MEACLGGRKDHESNFHHYEGAVELMPACLCGMKERESSFHHSGAPVKLVHAYLRAELW